MERELYKYKTLNELLCARSKETHKGIRFISSSKEEIFISYAEFYKQVINYLGVLQTTTNIKQGDEVIVFEADNHKFLIGFWACLIGGYTPIPVAIGGKDEHKLKFFRIWNDLIKPHVFSSKENIDKLISFGFKKNIIDEEVTIRENFLDSTDVLESIKEGKQLEVSASDLAFIQYSSGSTGKPKGVMLTHENLIYNTYDLMVAFKMDANDVFFSWIPLTHDMGMIAFHLTSLITGCDQIIMPTSVFIRRPLLWMEKTNEYRASKLCSPNFGYQYFLQALERKDLNELDWDLSCVEIIVNGAEPISAKICKKFTSTLAKYKIPENCIAPSYGLAEASVGASIGDTAISVEQYFVNRNSLTIENEIQFEDSYEEGKTLSFVGVGKGLASTEIRINDEKGNSLGKNRLGFIDIKGKNVTKGYYRNEEATKAVFVKDGWLRTGDLGFLLENDILVITGRQKNMIILQGQNYYAHDIEDIIIGVENISLGKVAVCGVSGNGEQKEKLLVFVYYKKNVTSFLNTIIAIQDKLSEVLEIIPDTIIPVREIPKTTSGKVQHSLLLKKYQNDDFKSIEKEINFAMQNYTIEEWNTSSSKIKEVNNWLKKQSTIILHLTNEVLDVQRPLGDQGFKSIHAVQLSQIIKTRLGIICTPAILYKYPTLYQLSEYINDELFREVKEEDSTEEVLFKNDDSILTKIESLSEEEILQMLQI